MIFLDMDGVLCDFASEAFIANGETFDPNKYPVGEWSIEKVLGITAETFWENIHAWGEGFWANLSPYPWMKSLVDLCCEYDQVVIATSPSKSPASYSGKRRWLDKHGLTRLHSFFGSQKHLLATSGRTLVDDANHNIDKWRMAGGHGILVPQPWNGQTGDVLEVVKVGLESIYAC